MESGLPLNLPQSSYFSFSSSGIAGLLHHILLMPMILGGQKEGNMWSVIQVCNPWTGKLRRKKFMLQARQGYTAKTISPRAEQWLEKCLWWFLISLNPLVKCLTQSESLNSYPMLRFEGKEHPLRFPFCPSFVHKGWKEWWGPKDWARWCQTGR